VSGANELDDQERTRLAAALMDGFAGATGLAGNSPPDRYLWTDAFAVCNFLGLHRRTGKAAYLELALRLVNQVHHVLGRHREDDPRRGWISGLDEGEGERHPTRGGLRIGKKHPERAPGEPFDPHAEWDRDGQYLHYLTQWMHALHRVAEETGDRQFRTWAVELARAAHAAFARRRTPNAIERLVWKMSVDLRRVLVPSMGQHDALDALTTCLELQEDGPVLEREIAELHPLAAAGAFETDDALGIGALLTDAYRLAMLTRPGKLAERTLLARLLAAAQVSLEAFAHGDPLSAPARSRLAFRELGLSIGLHAMERLQDVSDIDTGFGSVFAAVLARAPIAARIDAFWSAAGNRQVASWTAHRHINDVMLATSLQPAGYLGD
jgi:hypothetical protein